MYMFMFRRQKKTVQQQGSNFWERHEQIKISFTNKLRTDQIRGILTTIYFGIFCIPTSYFLPKTEN
jgi:hypothetical protein